MKYHATLKAINSKADVCGNRYWVLTYIDHNTGNCWSATVFGDGSNIRSSARTESGDWDPGVLHEEIEMPIRAFNRLSKGLPHAGCRPEDIRRAIMENINN